MLAMPAGKRGATLPGWLLAGAAASAAVWAGAATAPAAGTVPAAPEPNLERSVRAHMEFLAGDALDGRGSGTRDEWIAATYLGARMRDFGLEPLGDAGGFVQQVGLQRMRAANPPQLHAGDATLTHGAQMLVLDTEDATAAGALHRFHPGAQVSPGEVLLMPPEADPEHANGLDAAAMVLWRENATLRELWPTLAARPLIIGRTQFVGVTPPAVAPRHVPVQIVLDAVGYEAVKRVPENAPISFVARTQVVASHTWNALGLLRGADPAAAKQIVLLSAHLDHLGEQGAGPDRIYNGADDDASGTIAVMELAEALVKGPRPRRSVVFALFGSEEAGSLGARYFLDKPTVPVAQIIANLEFEMIGRSDPAVPEHTLWLTGWQRSNLGPALAAHGARLVGDPHPKENFFMRSDNITLARHGVVAQTVSSFGLHAQYHQPDDDIAHIDFAHMTESIRSLLAPVRWLADSDFMPQWRAGGRP